MKHNTKNLVHTNQDISDVYVHSLSYIYVLFKNTSSIVFFIDTFLTIPLTHSLSLPIITYLLSLLTHLFLYIKFWLPACRLSLSSAYSFILSFSQTNLLKWKTPVPSDTQPIVFKIKNHWKKKLTLKIRLKSLKNAISILFFQLCILIYFDFLATITCGMGEIAGTGLLTVGVVAGSVVLLADTWMGLEGRITDLDILEMGPKRLTIGGSNGIKSSFLLGLASSFFAMSVR